MLKQIALALGLIALPVALFTAFEAYTINSSAEAKTGLGDLSSFKAIITDVQALVDQGNMSAAAKRITDFESAWDQAETAIRSLNPTQWTNIDEAADGALSAVRKHNPDPAAAKSALSVLVAELDDPSKTP